MVFRPAIGRLEVHAENYLGGGPAPARLDMIGQEYPLSLHGVGLSLGSAEGLADEHLRRLRALIARTEPFLVSEHLSWSITGDAYLNDLLPLPYTEESLDIVADNVATAQAALGRPSVNNRTGLCPTEMEIEKWRPETGVQNPPRTDRNGKNCRTETGTCKPNPRECRGFSHTGK